MQILAKMSYQAKILLQKVLIEEGLILIVRWQLVFYNLKMIKLKLKNLMKSYLMRIKPYLVAIDEKNLNFHQSCSNKKLRFIIRLICKINQNFSLWNSSVSYLILYWPPFSLSTEFLLREPSVSSHFTSTFQVSFSVE